MKIYTIGVYGSNEESFYSKLKEHQIDLFCDIRLRRGMRGREYAFVNAKYLEDKLNTLGIAYEHIKDLAPTKEIRLLQKEADLRSGVQKKVRQQLGSLFIHHYSNSILKDYDFAKLYQHFLDVRAERVVLFCVEECHNACHRSLVAERLKTLYNLEVIHI